MLIAFDKERDDAALAVGLVNTWDPMLREPESLGDAAAARELRAAAIRQDARLRREEVRRWRLLTRDARARTRRR